MESLAYLYIRLKWLKFADFSEDFTKLLDFLFKGAFPFSSEQCSDNFFEESSCLVFPFSAIFQYKQQSFTATILLKHKITKVPSVEILNIQYIHK